MFIFGWGGEVNTKDIKKDVENKKTCLTDEVVTSSNKVPPQPFYTEKQKALR